jgi:ABC-type molybdate transport system substrate-binding protein
MKTLKTLIVLACACLCAAAVQGARYHVSVAASLTDHYEY